MHAPIRVIFPRGINFLIKGRWARRSPAGCTCRLVLSLRPGSGVMKHIADYILSVLHNLKS